MMGNKQNNNKQNLVEMATLGWEEQHSTVKNLPFPRTPCLHTFVKYEGSNFLAQLITSCISRKGGKNHSFAWKSWASYLKKKKKKLLQPMYMFFARYTRLPGQQITVNVTLFLCSFNIGTSAEWLIPMVESPLTATIISPHLRRETMRISKLHNPTYCRKWPEFAILRCLCLGMMED